MDDYVIVRGNTAPWAIPSAAVRRVCHADEWPDGGAETSALLDLDVHAEPRRVLELAGRRGSVPLLVSGSVEIARRARADVLEAPGVLKECSTGRLVSSVLTDGAHAVAWVLDVDALDELGGDGSR